MGLLLSSKDSALPFAELHEIPTSPFLQSVKVPLDACTTLWCISCFLKSCVTCRLAEDTLCPSVEVINEDVKANRTWPHPWGFLLLTGPQLHSLPLAAILSAWQFSHFSVHLTVCFSSLFFTSCSPYNLSALQWIGKEVNLQQETLVLDNTKEFFQSFTRHWDRFCEETVAGINDPLRSYPDFFFFHPEQHFQKHQLYLFLPQNELNLSLISWMLPGTPQEMRKG